MSAVCRGKRQLLHIMLPKQEKRKRRHRRARSKIFGTSKVPRLCVFRSAKHIYAQLIDDSQAKTIVSSSDFEIKELKEKSKKTKSAAQENKTEKNRKVALAYKVGEVIAAKAVGRKIKKIVFDRGGYKYHGRVKAVADGARAGGLEF
jgi:large subunit ribosomal protein L18